MNASEVKVGSLADSESVQLTARDNASEPQEHEDSRNSSHLGAGQNEEAVEVSLSISHVSADVQNEENNEAPHPHDSHRVSVEERNDTVEEESGALESDSEMSPTDTSELKKPKRVIPAWLFVIANVIVSTLVSAGLNALVAWLMYSAEAELVSVWGFPHTIAADLGITSILLWAMTWMIGTAVGVHDLVGRYPLAIRRSTMPCSWADALYRTPMLIPLCCSRHDTADVVDDEGDSASDRSDDGKTTSSRNRVSLTSIFARSLAHETPMCPPAIDDPDNPPSEELLLQVLGNLQGDEAGGEPTSACCNSAGLKSEFLAFWPFVVVTVVFVAMPLAGLLTLRGTEAGLWSVGDLILIKVLYGAILEIPISWVICVSVMLWYRRRRDAVLARFAEGSQMSLLEKESGSRQDELQAKA